MYRKLTLTLAAFLFIHYASAQDKNISGILQDTTSKSPVKNAVVALLSPNDSMLVDFTRSADDGTYHLHKASTGNYILMVMHPQFADFVDDVSITSPNQKISSIALTAKSKLLEAIILKSGSPMRIKGDTTIYTADSFNVSANANVEELLKKMPGFQVDKDGQIKQMGVKVEKILVDGEEFFGDDPGMAVKNLRADAVKEVQVFDKKSDQAEFTGIDDGNSKKTINLKLKEDKKTGYFGKMDVSGGTQKNIDDRYNNNLLFSTFKGKRKLTAFLLNGNTGQDGLSWQDNEKYGGENDNYSVSMDEDGGVMYSWKGGSTDEEPYVNTDNGFIRNINGGVQYSNKWNDRQTFNFAPKYNAQDYYNTQRTYTQTLISPDSVYNDNATQNAHVNRYNVKISSTYDVKIDSNNTIKFTAKANFYHTENDNITLSERRDIKDFLINRSDIRNNSDFDKQSITGSMLFKHKFKKARRTLSVNVDYNNLNTNGDNFLRSAYESFDGINPSLTTDRKIDVDRNTQKLATKFVYTEPLTARYSLELSDEVTVNKGTNNQQTYNFNSSNEKYDDLVDTLTNDFKTSILVNRPGVKISYNYKKIKFNIGSGVGITHFNLMDKTYDKEYIRNYTNFFPAAKFSYAYKSNHSLQIDYSGYNRQPTINQLQPLRNNNDEFNQYIGNPDLKPSFTNTLNISHNGYNFLKDIWTYQSIYSSLTSNSITNSRSYIGSKTISQPINTDGNLNVNFYGGMGFKLKKIDTRFNVNANGGYTKFADVINGNLSHSRTTNAGISMYASKSKDKKYDFSVSESYNYNHNKSTTSLSSNSYSTNTAAADATIYYKKVWSINSDYQFYYRQKVNDQGSDLDNHLWNARLQRTLRNNEFTIYLKVRDILNQNVGIDRNFYGNTYTEQRNDRLKRYYLLGFTWDFKNKAAKTK